MSFVDSLHRFIDSKFLAKMQKPATFQPSLYHSELLVVIFEPTCLCSLFFCFLGEKSAPNLIWSKSLNQQFGENELMYT